MGVGAPSKKPRFAFPDGGMAFQSRWAFFGKGTPMKNRGRNDDRYVRR